jgi:hypothetical protein
MNEIIAAAAAVTAVTASEIRAAMAAAEYRAGIEGRDDVARNDAARAVAAALAASPAYAAVTARFGAGDVAGLIWVDRATPDDVMEILGGASANRAEADAAAVLAQAQDKAEEICRSFLDPKHIIWGEGHSRDQDGFLEGSGGYTFTTRSLTAAGRAAVAAARRAVSLGWDAEKAGKEAAKKANSL